MVQLIVSANVKAAHLVSTGPIGSIEKARGIIHKSVQVLSKLRLVPLTAGRGALAHLLKPLNLQHFPLVKSVPSIRLHLIQPVMYNRAVETNLGPYFAFGLLITVLVVGVVVIGRRRSET